MNAIEYYQQLGLDLYTFNPKIRAIIGSQFLEKNPLTVEEIKKIFLNRDKNDSASETPIETKETDKNS